jgi:hypothetical protein
MQHHRSIGTATLVALMAAHRAAALQQPTRPREVAPLDTRQIARAVERLSSPEPQPSGGDRQLLA